MGLASLIVSVSVSDTVLDNGSAIWFLEGQCKARENLFRTLLVKKKLRDNVA